MQAEPTGKWSLCTDVKLPHLLTFHGDTVPVNLRSTGILPLCTSVLRGVDVHGYGSISCMTSVQILLLSADVKIPLFLVILFLEPFLELLGSEFPQK